MKFKHLILLFFTVILFSGCAAVISKETLSRVDKTVSFKEIKANPAKFNGVAVLLGGKIVGIENVQNRTLIEIFEMPLNSSNRPVNPDKSSGRFIAASSDFLDPAIYEEGRMITIAGVVEGTLKRPLGQTTYSYPLVSLVEEHLFKEKESYRPSLHLGVGVGGRF
ncbi:MAG: Slp family lipoprotein [Thermodesulfobacteriota bacterium]